jgi:splicing factor, arginine/serine-rich 17
LRIIKSSLEFIRCEGEIENKSSFKTLLSKLDGCSIKMNQYVDVLKVRAAEAKISFPVRHDWESYFKDSLNPSVEYKPGERPDTVYLVDLPCKWFAQMQSGGASEEKPSEAVLKEVFAIFGEVRMIDIPLLTSVDSDSMRKHTYLVSESTGGSFSPSHSSSSSSSSPKLQLFDAFVQYKDYISFVKAMDTFRGMKLLYVDENKNAYTANIRVDFDRTKHLSDKEIKRREIDKLKAIEIAKIKNAQMEKEKEKEAKQREIANYRQMLEESIGSSFKSDAASNEESGKANSDEKSKEQRRRER